MGDAGSEQASSWAAPGPRVIPPPPVAPPAPSPAPPAQWTPPLPPAPAQWAPPPPPPRVPPKGFPWWAWLLVAGGGLALIGLIIWLAAMVSGAVSAVAGPLGSAFQDGFEEGYYGGPSDPLETGAPGAQFAAEPVVCPGVCLTNTGAHFAALTVATTGRFGMSEQSMTDGDVPAFTSETAFNDALASWSGNNRQCVFVNTWVPVFVSYDGALSERATVDLLGQWSDADALSTVTVGTAVFPDSAAAEAHIGRTADAIAGCDFYQVGDPEGGQVDVEVNPAPAVANLHPTIAAVGWIESGPYDRYYVTELQRGEIVVRVTVQTYGGLTQPDAQLLTGMVANRFAEEPLLHG